MDQTLTNTSNSSQHSFMKNVIGLKVYKDPRGILRYSYPETQLSSATEVLSTQQSTFTIISERARGLHPDAPRIYVPRDYTHGLGMRFSTEISLIMLDELKIEDWLWERTMKEINRICDNAEKYGLRTIWETISSCLTFGFLSCRRGSHYENCTKELSEFIKNQTRHIYGPRYGILIRDPRENGYRHIEIIVLEPNMIQLDPSREESMENELEVPVLDTE